MNFFLNLNKLLSKKTFLISYCAVISLLVGVTATYSWLIFISIINRNEFDPGELDSSLEIMCWNEESISNDKWEIMQINNDGTSLPVLGEIRDITRLPDNSYAYMKIKVYEDSLEVYQYNLTVEDILIEIVSFEFGNVTEDPTNGNEVNYFDSPSSQKCFDYYYTFNDNGKTPGELFPNPENISTTHLSTRGQSLTNNTYILGEKWLYIMLVPRLAEIQNIIMIVPIDYSPYQIIFTFNFKSEVMTFDGE